LGREERERWTRFCHPQGGQRRAAQRGDDVATPFVAGKIVGADEILVAQLIRLERHPFRIDLADRKPFFNEKRNEVGQQLARRKIDRAVFELHHVDRTASETVGEAFQHAELGPLDIDLQQIDMGDRMGAQIGVAGGHAGGGLDNLAQPLILGREFDRRTQRAALGIAVER
jgi:hypothetical protein